MLPENKNTAQFIVYSLTAIRADASRKDYIMKKRVYTSLYLLELLYPILFCVAIIVLQLMFYIRLLDGTDKVAPSAPVELLIIIVMLALIVFIVLYMLWRFVSFDDKGVYYKDIRKSYFIPWENVHYVKITFNGNQKIGRGSYIVITSSQYSLQYTDFRASREDFVVVRYRISALDIVKKHYDGEIIRAASIK